MEKYLTLAEVKDMLENAKKERELNYEQARALEYCQKFAKLNADKAREMVEELTKTGIEERVAVKIADFCPKTEDEIAAIFAKEKNQPKETKTIIEIVSRYI